MGLEQRPDAIANPWNLIIETGDNSPQPLPEGTKVIDIFDEIGAGRTLLILGEPGSGKTTTLLELARDLIACAEQDVNLLIPVVFNLSSWASKQQKIADWLVEELNSKYDVPKKIGQAWVTQQQLLPLLDGLDEVKAEYRDDCIVALNQFKQEYGAELVVCSRIKDYEALSNRLNFQSAVYLKLLSLEQVCSYLDSVGGELRGLRTLIAEDKVLQELAQSPLMLHIMTLAYQGVAVEDLPKTEVLEERRKKLFDDYIEQMFKRRNRSKSEQRYSKHQTSHWLAWLAQRMLQKSKTVFLIEELEPLDIKGKFSLFQYLLLFSIIIFVINCPVITFCVLQLVKFNYLDYSLLEFYERISFISLFSIFLSLTDDYNDPIINLSLKIKFKMPSIKELKNEVLMPSLIVFFAPEIINQMVLVLFRVAVLGYIISGKLPVHIIYSNKSVRRIRFIFKTTLFILMFPVLILIFLIFSLINLLIIFLIEKIEKYPTPNYGMKEALKTAFLTSILFLMYAVIAFQTTVAYYEIIISFLLGFLAYLSYLPLIKHISLRLVLLQSGSIPWNYARFLDYAAERIFLQKVGGGYIFIHRMLMEHFAQMELE